MRVTVRKAVRGRTTTATHSQPYQPYSTTQLQYISNDFVDKRYICMVNSGSEHSHAWKNMYSTLAINRQVRKKRKTPNHTHKFMHVHADIYTTQKHTYTKTYNHTKEVGP